MSLKSLCVKSELCLFEPINEQGVMESAMWVDCHPTATIDNATYVEFNIYNNNANEYLDMNDTVLEVKACVLSKDGKQLTADAVPAISTTNYLLPAMFEDVAVYLNNVKIEGGTNLYPYKAVLQNELNLSSETRRLQLETSGYLPDVAIRKQRYCDNSVTFQLMGSLNVDFFQTQSKYLLPRVNVRVRLTKSKHDFVLQVDGTKHQPQLKLLDAVLYVRKVQCTPAVSMGHELGLKTHPATYPYTRTEIIPHQVVSGTQSCIRDNLFHGVCPKFVIICMVDERALAGNYKLDPFEFAHFNVTHVSLSLNGQSIPYRAGYNPDFANNQYAREYFISMVQNLEFMRLDRNNGISMADWVSNGRCIFTFNLTPDFMLTQEQPKRQGNLRLNLRFMEPLKQSINVLICGLSDTHLKITKNREIIHE